MNPESPARATAFTPLQVRGRSTSLKRPVIHSLFQEDPEEVPSVPPPAKRSLLRVEDPPTQGKRLRAEGIFLAEQGRFWQAIHLWNQALDILPQDVRLLEMKAQALIQVHEWEPAIEIGRKVTQIDPLWWEGYQTWGRALVGGGRVPEARWAFSKAAFLNPSDRELRIEDLLWSQELYRHWKAEQEARRPVTEI
ncbi:hypothetical protein TCAL_01305 [Tigriopus californicus]|uniref:Uncharacterized protein n=1 Tax=Tigriopus californicus TaxID=6832 RepID=A0A553P9U5_TIGCA|nr:tetratricopeptide repeat protein 33-like [Tigriopus californicus]TRY74438.1 hypothetical protein TCAL_01305 [Tigriopus californicus]|eukprot:TCALIF_01305-PA protein Name:"Similar to ttc33 Tetratricopeptide repeat protein 33 (Danio rerio)" AED:0.54 eAED:0.54 QI:0/-1/0/1/-1/1/1/0/193